MKTDTNKITTPAHQSTPIQQRWLTPAEAARHLNCSKNFLDVDRLKLRRIPFARLGRAIRYDVADLDAFLESTKNVPAE